MFIRYLKFILIIFLPLFIFSCEEDVKNAKMPDFEQKLVISSFISPSDSAPYINVDTNHRLYGRLDQTESVGNISGTLSDGVNETILQIANNGLTLDTGKVKIEPGKTYFLKVMSDKGMSAEAECTIPSRKEFNLTTDTSSVFHQVTGYKAWRQYFVGASFYVIPGEENYFRLQGEIIYFTINQLTNKVARYRENVRFANDLFRTSDADNNFRIAEKTSVSRDLNYYDSVFFRVSLLNTEKSYFLYHRSLKNNTYGGDPFTEPTPVFSNINGGLGIFTSFTVQSMTVRIR